MRFARAACLFLGAALAAAAIASPRAGSTARRPGARPVDLEVLPDGSLLVSDDAAGAIYRISYSRTH